MNSLMIACLDVAYGAASATAACVIAGDWTSAAPIRELTHCCPLNVEYLSGQFYRRELPCLLAILKLLPERPDVVVIDGYVWLNVDRKPGLGGHLYAALGGKTPVIGVAKRPFRGAPSVEVRRGRSRVPLFVSSAGIALEEAAQRVIRMNGPFRIPTLLKRADLLSRSRSP
jgi:deoxyribonuclease V